MGSDSAFDPRLSIWNTWRRMVLGLGHQLHERLGATAPVTIHGRDLRHDDEGVGFQFQYMLADLADAGDARTAFYVLQIQLKKRPPAIGWEIDAVPVIERTNGSYQLYERRSFAIPLREHARLAEIVSADLASDAAAFFDAVSTGRAIDAGKATSAQPAQR